MGKKLEKKARWAVLGVALALWATALTGNMIFESNRSQAVADLAARKAATKPPAELQASEDAPKYVWNTAVIADPAIMGTHVTLGAPKEDCDLSPGWQCAMQAVADKDGKISVPAHWRRPIGDNLKTGLASHISGSSLKLAPEGFVVAGFEPGQVVRFKAAMGLYIGTQGEPEYRRHVQRDNGGLVDCLQTCLLMLSDFKPVVEEEVPQPEPLGWWESRWPRGWVAATPSLALLLLALWVGPALRMSRNLVVMLGFPGSVLKLKSRPD